MLTPLAERIVKRTAAVFEETTAPSSNGQIPNELSLDMIPYLHCIFDIAGCMDQTNGSILASLVPTLLSTIQFGTRRREDETEVSTVNCDVVESSLRILSRMAEHTPSALQRVASDVTKLAIEVFISLSHTY